MLLLPEHAASGSSRALEEDGDECAAAVVAEEEETLELVDFNTDSAADRSFVADSTLNWGAMRPRAARAASAAVAAAAEEEAGSRAAVAAGEGARGLLLLPRGMFVCCLTDASMASILSYYQWKRSTMAYDRRLKK